MTPTREEYEYAAKAAGIEIEWAYGYPRFPVPLPWKPLEDGDDSQDLQARIEADIEYTPIRVDARGYIRTKQGLVPVRPRRVSYDGTLEDRLRALREAIFRLAVEIGRGDAVIIVIVHTERDTSKLVVSHGVNDVDDLVVLPQLHPSQIGAVFDPMIGEYVLREGRGME